MPLQTKNFRPGYNSLVVIPLEQGLKPTLGLYDTASQQDSRSNSIRTRIETPFGQQK